MLFCTLLFTKTGLVHLVCSHPLVRITGFHPYKSTLNSEIKSSEFEQQDKKQRPWAIGQSSPSRPTMTKMIIIGTIDLLLIIPPKATMLLLVFLPYPRTPSRTMIQVVLRFTWASGWENKRAPIPLKFNILMSDLLHNLPCFRLSEKKDLVFSPN